MGRPRGCAAALKLDILYSDDDLLVVDKPAGLLSVTTPGARGRTVVDALREQGLEVLAVHRLDRDVSGALLLARNEPAREALERLFRARALTKVYWALAQGRLARPEGELKDPILDEGRYARVSARGKPSLTRYRVLRAFAAASEVEVELVTGRYNQIRLHMAHHGHPLVGERKYARGRDDPLGSRRVALHAWRLELTHPGTGAALRVEAPLPEELRRLLERASAPASRPRSGPR
jgi:RluA family pseudouridine synthase